jgi:PAS domain S-box-containing protein
MKKNEASKLKALSDIATIDITLEFGDILNNILKITCKTMDAHSGTIMLVDENTKELKMVAKCGLPEDYITRVYEAAEKAGVPITYSPSGIVLETGKNYLVPDILKELRNEPWWHLAKEIGFSSMLFSPMKRGKYVIGLLNVYWEKPRGFMEEEINFVSIAASHASSVVQNAKMCERIKGNIHELKEKKENLEGKLKVKHRELFESENYQRTIINSSLDGIMVVDEKGRFEFGNHSTFIILGWPKEELIGQFFMKVIPDDMTDFMLERWIEIQNGLEKQYETKIKTKKGEIKNIFISHAPTEINGKRKYVVVFKDISYNKKLEQQLKQSEERYRDLFENANDPMYTIDTSGYFQSMNNSALQILGVTKEEIIGSHMSSLLTEESYAIALDILKKQISCQPFEQPIILEIICKNGEHHWGEFKSRIIKDGSKIIGVHGIGRDITEKKKLEEQLKEYHEKLKKSYEELKETEKLKNEFISNITHELMTPLTSIKGYSELLYNDALGKTSFKQKGSLEVILRNSERLMSRIQDLLDIAALENDEILFNHNSVSINEIINESIQDLEPKLLTKEIDVIKNTAISSSIPGDKEKLLQVITNILSNAIKFTSNKGKITITVSEDQDEIKISIKDTGIGIPEDKLERVFDRFFQVDSSSSRKYGGFGLGLSICRSIVEKHNGLIWAESNGNGSTFNIALPKITSKQKGKLNVGTRP